MLNITIGAWFDEYISTPGKSIEVKAVHLRSKNFQLGNLYSSLVGEKRTESAVFSQRG